jgi:hypothetical protein
MHRQLAIWSAALVGSALLAGGATCFLLGTPGAPLAPFAWPGYLLALLGALVLLMVGTLEWNSAPILSSFTRPDRRPVLRRLGIPFATNRRQPSGG